MRLVFAMALFFGSAGHSSAQPVQVAPAVTVELDHIALQTRDLVRSAAFYEKVLGLQRIPDPFQDGRHVWLRIGPHLALHLIGPVDEVVHTPIYVHFCVRVASLDAFLESLDRAHVPYRDTAGASKPQVRADGVRQVYLQDPDGFWIEVNDAKY